MEADGQCKKLKQNVKEAFVLRKKKNFKFLFELAWHTFQKSAVEAAL